MKSLLFLDTETNCFADEIGADTYKRPHFEEDGSLIYPHISQISWIITSTGGKELLRRDFIIKPVGYSISENATSVHKIDNVFALEHGVNIEDVMTILKNDIDAYDVYKICGHNVKFDIHMIEAEALRIDDEDFYNEIVDFHYEDTCSNSKIMHYVGGLDKRGRIKRPRLGELYIKLFGHDFEGAHNSLSDIIATKECFFECVNLGLIDRMIFD